MSCWIKPTDKAKEAMHLAHPFGIAAGEVVVHRHHVHTATGQGIEVAGQGGDQGFAFAGFHLSDLAFMQHHAADQLHIEVAHAEHTLAGFAHHGKGFGQDLVEDRALVLRLPALASRSWKAAVLPRSSSSLREQSPLPAD